MQNHPTQPDARTHEAWELSALAARLLRRHDEPLGLIDVKHAARHYARLTLRLAERFPLLGYLQTRYGDEHEASPESQTFLLRQWGEPSNSPSSLSPPPLQSERPSNLAANLSPSPLAASASPAATAKLEARSAAAPATQPAQKLRVSRRSARRAPRGGLETAAIAQTPSASRTPAGLPTAANPERSTPPEGAGSVAHASERPLATRPPLTETLPLAVRKAAEDKTAEAHSRSEITLSESERPAMSDPDPPPRDAVQAYASGARAAGSSHPSGTTTHLSGAPTTPADKVTHVLRADLRVSEAIGDIQPSTLPLPEQRGAREEAWRASDSAVASRLRRAADAPPALPSAERELLPLVYASRPTEVKNGKSVIPTTVEMRDGTGVGPQSPEMVWPKRDGRMAGGDDFRPGAAGGGETLLAARQGEGSVASPAPPGARQTFAPAARAPAREEEIDIGRLTERVMRAISRRLSVERERRGLRG